MSSYSAAIKQSRITMAACLFTLGASLPVYADDTEIYLGGAGSTSGQANVVFIIDTSGSMLKTVQNKVEEQDKDDDDREEDVVDNGKTKIQIVKDVFTSMMSEDLGVNAAIMRFDDKNKTANKGGYFIQEMQSLTTGTRQAFINSVNDLDPKQNAYTPLSETLYEASQYYRGGSVEFGNSTTPGQNVAGVLTGGAGSTYKSPIATECQKNYTILLTDGEPTYDYDANVKINALISTGKGDGDKSCDNTATGELASSDNCLDEMAYYLANNDMAPGSTIANDQFVNTYTIGFDTPESGALLTATAEAGGGEFFPATGSVTLKKALNSILKMVAVENTSFAAPAMSLNAFNSLQHNNELYYTQFKPASEARWRGNIKSYELKYGVDGGSCEDKKTTFDANNNEALENGDPNLCHERFQVKDSARSAWSDSADGKNVLLGGAANKLNPNVGSRNVYTFIGALTPDINNDKTLASLDTGNGDLTHTVFGFTTAEADADTGNAKLESLINWARGLDVDDENGNSDKTDARLSMGDSLHTVPVPVTYELHAPDKKLNQTTVLYAATNEGYLHAIDVSIVDGKNDGAGEELFAFIPEELLPNLKTLKNNTSTAKHPYGLDGDITVWRHDRNNDGNIVVAEGDRVYLFVGMRRGGKSYFALDVSVKETPKLMWKITGGIPDTDFYELGQTWSKPVLARMKLGTDDSDMSFLPGGGGASTLGTPLGYNNVLVFGGGYDVNQDTATTATPDTSGRAIFVVDARTGERLWWAGQGNDANLQLTDMQYSIPSEIRVLDTDLDPKGLHDRFYVGDMHAQLFRFDIKNSFKVSEPTVITGYTIAQLGGTKDIDNRRFFYAPDIVVAQPHIGLSYLSINIGTGYRAHPLNTTIQDKFYSIRDDAVFKSPASPPPPKTPVSLTDATLAAPATPGDWYLNLDAGEKVLSRAVTFGSKVFFTTYSPSTNPASCETASIGAGKIYEVNLFTAAEYSPADSVIYGEEYQSNPDTATSSRSHDLGAGGIPPAPSIVFAPKPLLCVGMQCFQDKKNLAINFEDAYWEQKE